MEVAFSQWHSNSLHSFQFSFSVLVRQRFLKTKIEDWRKIVSEPRFFIVVSGRYLFIALKFNTLWGSLNASNKSSSHLPTYVVTLARPPSSSCLKITDRSFRYASPCLWSTSFWYQFLHFRLAYSFSHHFFLFWFITLLIHNSLSLSFSLSLSLLV